MAFQLKNWQNRSDRHMKKQSAKRQKKLRKPPSICGEERVKTIHGGEIRTEWAKQSSCGLQLTPTSAELRQAKREIDEVSKADREKEMQESDFKYSYSTNCSSSSYEKQRHDTVLDTREGGEANEKVI